VLDDEPTGVLAGFLAGTREVAVRVAQQLHEPLSRKRLTSEEVPLVHTGRLPARDRFTC
jgi:hypothetical protein